MAIQPVNEQKQTIWALTKRVMQAGAGVRNDKPHTSKRLQKYEFYKSYIIAINVKIKMSFTSSCDRDADG